jgi:hypothetical protein
MCLLRYNNNDNISNVPNGITNTIETLVCTHLIVAGEPVQRLNHSHDNKKEKK